MAALAAALIVIGARWHLIEAVGSPVPFFDQWVAEGKVVNQPAMNGTLQLGNFFQTHNDHHIVPTRLLAYGLLVWNGQWDARVQMTVNALLAALVLLPLLALVRPWLGFPLLVVVAAGLAALYAQMIFYENALWGFQSQFYFLILFSLLQIRWMLAFSPGCVRWWLGLAAGGVAISAMGSGVLASAVVLAIGGWRWGVDKGSRSRWRASAVASALLLLAGLWWLPPTGSQVAFNAAVGIKTFFHALSFPSLTLSWLAALFWLPFGAFVLWIACKPQMFSAPGGVLLGSGLWVLLQIAAMAYARPESGWVLANRYNDILAVGLTVNFAALAWWWIESGVGRRPLFWRGILGAVCAVWVVVVVVKTRESGRALESHQAMFRDLRDEHIQRIGTFVQTDDASVITSATYPHIPLNDGPRLVEYLRLQELRKILPAEVRRPIGLGFVEEEGRPSLNNALPVTVPNEAGRHHRGTFFPDVGAGGQTTVRSQLATKSASTSLVFKVAGDLRKGETELRVLGSDDEVIAVITDLQADKLTPVEVPVSGTHFRVEVVDHSAERWLVFLEPVEVGPLSQWIPRVLGQAIRLEWLGTGILAGLLLWSAVVALRVRMRVRNFEFQR